MKEYVTEIIKIDESLIEEGNIDSLKELPALQRAAELLKEGEVVAFPTETVYGLGADATTPEAIKKIYQAKGRPQDNPLIVHIAAFNELDGLVKGSLNPLAERLIKAFWPGPLTIVVDKREIIPDETTAGLDSVAIRMPDHPLTRAIIQLAGVPIAAPSANKSGAPSPTRAEHVFADLQGRIPLILDGGPARVGLESTVVDVRSERVQILRPGGVSREEIREVIGAYLYEPGEEAGSIKKSRTAEKPLSPGMKYRHYSPETPLFIIKDESSLKKLLQSGLPENTALILSDEWASKYGPGLKDIKVIKMGPRERPELIAAGIFQLLRYLDTLSLDRAYIEAIPEKGIGEAIMNRIRKASSRE